MSTPSGRSRVRFRNSDVVEVRLSRQGLARLVDFIYTPSTGPRMPNWCRWAGASIITAFLQGPEAIS